MRVYHYDKYVIRNSDQQKVFRVYLKDGETLYSQLYFGSAKAAAYAMRKVVKAELLEPVNRFYAARTFYCKCGCGEQFIKDRLSNPKLYLRGHKPKSERNFLKAL